jgi:hypothetical protein
VCGALVLVFFRFEFVARGEVSVEEKQLFSSSLFSNATKTSTDEKLFDDDENGNRENARPSQSARLFDEGTNAKTFEIKIDFGDESGVFFFFFFFFFPRGRGRVCRR